MKYFFKTEFNCPCCNIEAMDLMFLQKLDVARDNAGVVFNISSGFRCPRHDLRVRNGKPNGSHPKGIAADIQILNNRQTYLIVMSLHAVGFTRIGIAKNFIHVDDDTTKLPHLIWTYGD